ncbi:uncharacterized protein LOC113382043 [Ctenocephalides felis]|uniref:uncharacterized protein LOC113382043 n=1 Tax=Ctenocephalides felis TaxID=7515 RepID=UPI000E6E1B99|nr:uncharacterized protein LOC113382043 [Ctenocephalides felis]
MLNKTWNGLHPSSALNLYRVLIRPKLDYGSWIFSNSRKIQDLDKIQYRCLRICIGAMKSTPTNVLLLESEEMPLEIRRKLLCDKYILKNIINNESVLNYKLMEIWRCIDRSTYWINKKVPDILTSFQFLKDYRKFNVVHGVHPYYEKLYYNKRTIVVKKEYKKWIEHDGPNSIILYTDGSRNNVSHRVGCAIWIEKEKIPICYKLPEFISIYSAELIAIREAVRIAKMNKYKKTMILTDSLSCVNKLEKFMNTIEFEEKIYFEILNDIEIITGMGNNINIGWVQGHIGVEGNEKADELAKTASVSGQEYNKLKQRRDGKKYGEKHRKEKEGITNYIMTVYRLNHGLRSLKMKKEVLLSPSVG